MLEKYDITILGGGPGGYVAAIRAAQLGFKTALIEKDNLGGICLNWGCIPTKSLLKNAEVIDLIKNHTSDFGIKIDGFSFDFNKIIKRSRDVSTKITRGVDFLMKKNKINVIKGFGKLITKNKIEIIYNSGEKIDEIETDKIIIATGAHPKILPNIPVDYKNIITSTEAMNLKKQPKDMIIIGAGAIGVEFAYFYNVLGTKVTLIEMMDSILPHEDKEVSKLLEVNFGKKGIDIFTSTKVVKAAIVNDVVNVRIEKDGKILDLHAEKVLSAVGVSGNIEGFGLQELGIEIEKNHIKVNKQNYQTNIENIYAIGDVIGPPWLAHVASAEGINCIENIKGLKPKPIDYGSIPGCTYSQPQIASIGMTEEKLKENNIDYKVGKFPFMASGKSSAIGEREGFVKILFDEKYGEILGAHIIGSDATELIAEIGIAKSLEATYETIFKTIHAHPTLSESVMEAAANAYGESIHI